MTEIVEIPVQGLSLQLPLSAIPPGPAGPPGVIRQRKRASAAPHSVVGTAWVLSLLTAEIVATGGAIDITAGGIVGHTILGGMVSLTVCRGTTMLHDPALSALAVARVPDIKDCPAWALSLRDTPPAGTHVYTIAWRQTSSDPAAVGYMGRRGLDTSVAVPSWLVLKEVAP